MFDNTDRAESTKYYYTVQLAYLFHRYSEMICHGNYYIECEMITVEDSVTSFNILFQQSPAVSEENHQKNLKRI
jgi:hypothetical protein